MLAGVYRQLRSAHACVQSRENARNTDADAVSRDDADNAHGHVPPASGDSRPRALRHAAEGSAHTDGPLRPERRPADAQAATRGRCLRDPVDDHRRPGRFPGCPRGGHLGKHQHVGVGA